MAKHFSKYSFSFLRSFLRILFARVKSHVREHTLLSNGTIPLNLGSAQYISFLIMFSFSLLRLYKPFHFPNPPKPAPSLLSQPRLPSRRSPQEKSLPAPAWQPLLFSSSPGQKALLFPPLHQPPDTDIPAPAPSPACGFLPEILPVWRPDPVPAVSLQRLHSPSRWDVR